MAFDYLPIGKEKERLACRKCKNVLFTVDYQALVKPKKGKRDKGFFGTCLACGEKAE
jgi:RNase P subunit RPR2